MTSIRDLAREYRAEEWEVRSFYPDLFTLDVSDVDELPADIVTAFWEAWGEAPDVADIVAENRDADAVLDALADVVNHAGYEDLS